MVYLLTIFCLGAAALSAAPQKPVTSPVPVNQNPWLRTPFEKAKKMPECMILLDKEAFLHNLLAFKANIEQKDPNEKPFDPVFLLSYKNAVLSWTKYRFFEGDTKISKKWLVKIANMFQQMYECEKAMDRFEAANDQKNFEVYHKAFKKLLEQYSKEIEDPDRPSQNAIQMQEEQKAKEKKGYRAYLKKMGKNGGGNDDDE